MHGHRRLMIVGLAALLGAIPASSAPILVSALDVFSSNPNDVLTRTFSYNPVTDGWAMHIQTWSYGGGTNIRGIAVPPGGFDPIVSLFSGTGSGAVLLAVNDDNGCPPGTPDTYCFDSGLVLSGLSAGNYTLAVTVFANFPIGPTFAQGFTGGGSFTDVAGRPRTRNIAVDVWGNIPEPMTMILIGSGLLAFGLRRRRSGV